MPAWRLDKTTRQVRKFDVGASDGVEAHFVRHVLLCDVDDPASVNGDSGAIQSVHMGPPLKESTAQIDVLGTAELDADGVGKGERRQIKTFIDDRWLERGAQKTRLEKMNRLQQLKAEYVIHPSAREPDSNYPLWRFNCSGFVLHAYLEANIELIDEEQVPSVALGFLKDAFPWARKRLEDPEFRKEMGIDTGEQWPVVMAGYVINSLNRPSNVIRQAPYVPRSGDRYFPARVEGESRPDSPAGAPVG